MTFGDGVERGDRDRRAHAGIQLVTVDAMHLLRGGRPTAVVAPSRYWHVSIGPITGRRHSADSDLL